MFGVAIDELIAANPQISSFPPPAGEVINLPAYANWPSPNPGGSPAAPVRTYPPLPAIAVVASGEFTKDEGISDFTVGTAIRLEFRFDGGGVIGSGSRPTYRRDGPTCKFTTHTKITFAGTFDPVTRQLAGMTEATDSTAVSYATTESCKSLAGTTTDTYAWTAQVSEDGQSLSGSVTDEGADLVQPFDAKVEPAE